MTSCHSRATTSALPSAAAARLSSQPALRAALGSIPSATCSAGLVALAAERWQELVSGKCPGSAASPYPKAIAEAPPLRGAAVGRLALPQVQPRSSYRRSGLSPGRTFLICVSVGGIGVTVCRDGSITPKLTPTAPGFNWTPPDHPGKTPLGVDFSRGRWTAGLCWSRFLMGLGGIRPPSASHRRTVLHA